MSSDGLIAKNGKWEIRSFEVTSKDAKFGELRAAVTGSRRYVPEGTYVGLFCNNSLIMSNTPDEIRDSWEFERNAKGAVLIHGLGLGVVLSRILINPAVKSVLVVEIDQDLIDLVGPHYTLDPRVTIVQGDALIWMPPKEVYWDAVWHDIWPDICADNYLDMKKLHRRFGRRCDWQGSWSREEVLYGRYGLRT